MTTTDTRAEQSGAESAATGPIDIHVHYRQPGQPFHPAPSWQPAERREAHARNAEIAESFERIVQVSQEAGVARRVLSLPASSRFDGFDAGPVPLDDVRRLNDYLADGVRTHPGLLSGLATIDAYTGEDGAAETRRAVEELGLSGIVLDSAKNDVLLGDPSTVPTLQEAAALGVPVFVHPTGTSLTPKLIEQAGQLGSSYGRGLANGGALLSLIHRGLLESIPGLRVVFTTLGIGSLGILGVWRERAGLTAAGGRSRVYFDTMGFDAQNVAFLISVLGADRVLIGSDWPYQVDATTDRVAAALDGAGVTAEQQELVLHRNAAALLVREPR